MGGNRQKVRLDASYFSLTFILKEINPYSFVIE